jgi:phosphatidyl-myo-inositol dimannoside synthase
VIDGETGVLLSAEPSSHELAEALVALLRDDARRSRLAEAGRAWVEERFTWDSAAAGAAKLLASVRRV